MQIFFVFVSAYEPYDTVIGNHLVKHGDGAKDIAFQVEELDAIVKVNYTRTQMEFKNNFVSVSLFCKIACERARGCIC